MNPTQTGIAVALALAVVVFFFVFNGMSFFSRSTTPQEVVATTTDQTVGTDNGSVASTTQSTENNVTQLQVTDEIVGTGATAQAGDSVTVQYVGSLTSGKIFDASASHGTSGFTFTLGTNPPQVIQGWDEGVVGMKVGGKENWSFPHRLDTALKSMDRFLRTPHLFLKLN